MTLIFISFLIIVIVLWLTVCLRRFNKATAASVALDVLDAYDQPQSLVFRQHLRHSQLAAKNSQQTERCTGKSLRVCSLTESNSCSSCSNPFAKCLHFSEDAKFVDLEGNEYNVPKNADSKQGYCLAAKLLKRPCNAIHGRLVLVERVDAFRKPAEREVDLACRCVNPGFVGGSSCETPFVCNGRVTDLALPLSKMECVCDLGWTFRRQNGIPTCVESTLHEEDWVGAKREEEKLTQPIGKEILSSSFTGTLPFEKISNPCSVCPISQQLTHGKAVNTSRDQTRANYECVSNGNTPWFGVPVRLHAENRLLKGSHGPDAVLAITFKSVYLYGRLNERERGTYVVVFDWENGKNAKIFDALQLDRGKEYFIRSTSHEFVWPGSFDLRGRLFDTIPTFDCYPHSVFYKCEFSQNYAIDNHPGACYSEIPSEQCMFSAPYKPVSKAPSLFLWGLGEWEQVAKLEKPFQLLPVKHREALTQMVEPDLYHDLSNEVSRRLKFLYAAVHRDTKSLSFYLASENDPSQNWKTYANHVYKDLTGKG